MYPPCPIKQTPMLPISPSVHVLVTFAFLGANLTKRYCVWDPPTGNSRCPNQFMYAISGFQQAKIDSKD